MTDAKSSLDKFARAAGFAGGAHWMYNNALMFIKRPDPPSHMHDVSGVDWMYVCTEPMPKTEHGAGAGMVVRAKSWEDLAARVCRALLEDRLYVHRSKIDKSSDAAAEFMVRCGLLGLDGEEEG